MHSRPPTVSADAHGLWEQNDLGQKRLGIAWDEIIAVGGARYEAGDRILFCVEFDHASGEVLEIFTDWPGFELMAQMVTDALPGMASSWLQSVTDLQPSDPSITVWRRS